LLKKTYENLSLTRKFREEVRLSMHVSYQSLPFSCFLLTPTVGEFGGGILIPDFVLNFIPWTTWQCSMKAFLVSKSTWQTLQYLFILFWISSLGGRIFLRSMSAETPKSGSCGGVGESRSLLTSDSGRNVSPKSKI